MGIQRRDIDGTVLPLEGAPPRERHLGDWPTSGRGRSQERYKGEECDGKLELHVATGGQRGAPETRGDILYMR